MLILPIKKKWFDMIAKGEKKEEYREIKPYYERRFTTVGLLDFWLGDNIPTGNERQVILRNGYGYCSPTMYVSVTLTIGEGKPEWGAEPNKKYYVLHIERVNRITVNGVTMWQNILR